MPAAFVQFAHVNDAAAATRSKLEKQRLLSEYFRELEDSDLRPAVRYAAGRVFAATDLRVLNVGGAMVSEVLLEFLKITPEEFYPRVVAAGEIGEAISTLWPQCAEQDAPLSPDQVQPKTAGDLQLADLQIAFDELARVGPASKRQVLRELLGRCMSGREAANLVKIIFGDLRTGVWEGVLQGAIARAFEQPLGKIQSSQLLIGDLEEVAILARQNRLETAAMRLFHPMQFMLASPQETAADAAQVLAGRPFFAEDKLDGIRAQVHKSCDRMAIYTRTLDRIDVSFPDVASEIAAIPGEFLLDGEIVPFRDGSVLPFANIQKRLGRKAVSAKVRKDHPCVFVAFDVLYRDGRLLMNEPLEVRRAQLEAIARQASLRITTVTHVSNEADISAAFSLARARRNEGIVLKDPASTYAPGRRGKMWLKLKTHLPSLDCVVTAAEYGRGKRRNSLSDYTFAVWNRDPADPAAKLVNVGKAYIGVSDEEITQLTETFLKLSRARRGHVHFVEPKIVLEIACDQIQKSPRHAGGFALRFPRVKRIRWDKRPEDADQLSRVAELFHSSANFAHDANAVEPAAEPTLFD